MAGIYIHIPFCSTKCHYCSFFSTVSLKHKDDTLRAIGLELQQQKAYLQNDEIRSIYFGGGTPSLLIFNELETILNIIRQHYPLAHAPEISLEANPDDIRPERLDEWKSLGINRLSIGTQAFNDELLHKLNRRHSASQAIDAVLLARRAGFDRLSIDLIYAIPGLSDTLWQQNMQQALALNVDHISAYHLTVEPGTALEKLIQKKRYPSIDDDHGIQQFDMLMHTMSEAGYEHYEISNFARNQRYSLHNMNYWTGEKYLGVGPSAHSFNGSSRRWNVASLKAYIYAVNQNAKAYEEEVLSPAELYNEALMLGLRTNRGVDIARLRQRFGPEREKHFLTLAQTFIDRGLMCRHHDSMLLTREGKKLADGIAAEFFISEDQE